MSQIPTKEEQSKLLTPLNFWRRNPKQDDNAKSKAYELPRSSHTEALKTQEMIQSSRAYA
jgi:hypothetical protein